MCSQWEEQWAFATENFRVVFDVAPCQDDPADSFQFEEDIAAVRDGDVEWFDARVRVLDTDGRELGADHLSCCAYTTVREFYTAHRDSPYDSRNTLELKARNTVICHYFPGMVAEAIAAARKTLAHMRALPVHA